LTKTVSTPLRITGSIISTLPIIGNPIDQGIDLIADSIDKVPL
jgi:hypothetical protein